MTSRMTFASAKKGALRSVQRAAGKGTKIMAIVDRHGLPVAVHVASVSPYEPHLVPATLDARFFADLPTRLIGDRGYDSDRLDDTLIGLEWVLRSAVPIQIQHDHAKELAEARARLETVPLEERAQLLFQIGHWCREMRDFFAARNALEECLSSVPAMFLDRPTLLRLFDELRRDYPDNPIVQASCDFYSANVLLADNRAVARERFLSAQQTFAGSLPIDHHVFAAIKQGLRECARRR